jgi:hypothetical protein
MQCVSWLWTVFWPSSDYFPGELKCRYGQLEIAILHGDLEQIANWVGAPRSSSKRPWSKGWNTLMCYDSFRWFAKANNVNYSLRLHCGILLFQVWPPTAFIPVPSTGSSYRPHQNSPIIPSYRATYHRDLGAGRSYNTTGKSCVRSLRCRRFRTPVNRDILPPIFFLTNRNICRRGHSCYTTNEINLGTASFPQF